MEYEAGVNTAHGKSKRNLYLIAGTVTILAFAIIFVVVLICTIKTEHELKETVMSRCQSYVDPYTSASSVQYCEDIWSAFEQAYVGKDPCSVPPEAYNPLINSFQQKIPCHKNLFWSRTKDMAHAFTKNRDCLITLEDTLVGFMFDGLKWCSSKGSKETFTTDCPGGTECPNNPVRSFWSRASDNFAATACGNVSVMLNGSIDTPFNPGSTFASIEVKNFNPAIIESLTVLLVNKETDRTTCSDESLENLQSILSSGPLKSVSYKCRVVHQAKVKDCIDDQKTLCGNCW